MKINIKAMLILTIILMFPLHNLYADECDDDYQKAKSHLETAREAHNEKDYELAAEYYEYAAEFFEQIAQRGECWCPKILRAAPSNAERYYEKASECRNWTQELKLHEEYNRAAGICREGHTCARNKNYEDAIDLFEEAAEIWDGIGEEAESQYCQKAISEAANAREAANYARRYIE
jgi:hypothetical protein